MQDFDGITTLDRLNIVGLLRYSAVAGSGAMMSHLFSMCGSHLTVMGHSPSAPAAYEAGAFQDELALRRGMCTVPSMDEQSDPKFVFKRLNAADQS